MTAAKSCVVVVAGHLCLDITPKFHDSDSAGRGKSISDILVPGKLVDVGACVVSTGGLVSNTGLALRRLGVDAVLMGKVGDDSFGFLIRQVLKGYGAEGGAVVAPGEETSYSIVIAPPGIDRVFIHNPGSNDTFVADDVDYEVLHGAGIFHFGYPPLMEKMFAEGGAEITDMFRRARATGATTSLDMALPDPDSPAGRVDWDAILRETLPYVDLFLPSIEEIAFSLDRDGFLAKRREAGRKGVDIMELFTAEDYSRFAERLISYGAGVVTLKAGVRGIYVRTAARERLERFGRAKPGDMSNWADRELFEPSFVADRVAFTTGAGDCAIAGFLAAFARGETIERTLRFAAGCGCLNVRVHDSVSGIVPYEEVARLMEGWRKVETPPCFRGEAGEGWRYDEEGQVFEKK